MRQRALVSPSSRSPSLAARRLRRRRRRDRRRRPPPRDDDRRTATADGRVARVVAGEPFPEDRCAANRGRRHDHLPVRVRLRRHGVDHRRRGRRRRPGYFDELCLDVELQPSFSTRQLPDHRRRRRRVRLGRLVQRGRRLRHRQRRRPDRRVDVEGRTAIDSLILKPGTAPTLEDLAGTTIGVKGKIPPSVAAMLAGAGLVEGDGLRDRAARRLRPDRPLTPSTASSGSPATRATSPASSSGPGSPFDLFDPTEYDVPGSFGVHLHDAARFAEEHRPPSRTSCGRRCAAWPTPSPIRPRRRRRPSTSSRPTATRASCRSEGESFRWATDAELLTAETPAGTGIGVPDLELLQAEVDAYAAVGLFGGEAPDAAPFVDVAPIAASTTATSVIWPG